MLIFTTLTPIIWPNQFDVNGNFKRRPITYGPVASNYRPSWVQSQVEMLRTPNSHAILRLMPGKPHQIEMISADENSVTGWQVLIYRYSWKWWISEILKAVYKASSKVLSFCWALWRVWSASTCIFSNIHLKRTCRHFKPYVRKSGVGDVLSHLIFHQLCLQQSVAFQWPLITMIGKVTRT